jgi:hypothetical protein
LKEEAKKERKKLLNNQRRNALIWNHYLEQMW